MMHRRIAQTHSAGEHNSAAQLTPGKSRQTHNFAVIAREFHLKPPASATGGDAVKLTRRGEPSNVTFERPKAYLIEAADAEAAMHTARWLAETMGMQIVVDRAVEAEYLATPRAAKAHQPQATKITKKTLRLPVHAHH